MSDAPRWPTELRLDPEKKMLTVTFDTGESFALAAEYLRVESPSAEVQGHTAAQKQTIAGKRDVKIEGLDPVGNYAVRIRFDDGHDTGLFSWEYLHELGVEHPKRWKAYLGALKGRGLSR
jgi:DUF971 family protein